MSIFWYVFIMTICLTCQINLKKIVFAHRKRKIYDRNYDSNSKQCIEKIWFLWIDSKKFKFEKFLKKFTKITPEFLSISKCLAHLRENLDAKSHQPLLGLQRVSNLAHKSKLWFLEIKRRKWYYYVNPWCPF